MQAAKVGRSVQAAGIRPPGVGQVGRVASPGSCDRGGLPDGSPQRLGRRVREACAGETGLGKRGRGACANAPSASLMNNAVMHPGAPPVSPGDPVHTPPLTVSHDDRWLWGLAGDENVGRICAGGVTLFPRCREPPPPPPLCQSGQWSPADVAGWGRTRANEI